MISVPAPIEMVRDAWNVLMAYPIWVVVVGWLLIAGPIHLVLQPLSAVYYALVGDTPAERLKLGRTQAVLGVIALSCAFPPLIMGLAMYIWWIT